MKKVFFVLSLLSGFLSASELMDEDCAPWEVIRISGIPKVEIIREFYKVALPTNSKSLDYLEGPLPDEDLAGLLSLSEIDYHRGRVMKIGFCEGHVLEVGKFNCWYGENKGQEIVEDLRRKFVVPD